MMFSLTLSMTVKYKILKQQKKYNNSNSLKPKKSSLEIFKVSRDTIHVQIEGKLTHVLLINNKYYTFYEVRDPMSTCSIKKCYILTKNGKVEKEITVPEEIHNQFYYDLFYWQGRIFVKNAQFEHETYYLDEDKGEFVRTKEINIPLYEDENYIITANCRGEFGSTIYFKSKINGMIYSSSSSCPSILNKLGDKYFAITNGSMGPFLNIIEINDPGNARGTDTRVKYNSKAPDHLLATKDIFNTQDDSFYMPTQFIANNALYYIYNTYTSDYRLEKERTIITKDSASIGIIKNGKFNPIYTFEDKFHIRLQQQLSHDYQICIFNTEERNQIGFKKDIPPYMEAKYGVIEIKNNDIKIHYFISKR